MKLLSLEPESSASANPAIPASRFVLRRGILYDTACEKSTLFYRKMGGMAENDNLRVKTCKISACLVQYTRFWLPLHAGQTEMVVFFYDAAFAAKTCRVSCANPNGGSKMNTQPQQKISVQTLTQLAILVAIEVVMKLIGLGSVPVGPLYMSFLTVPIAIGAIVIGPLASMLLGGVFGFVSFMDAIKGASIMTSTLLGVSAIHTFILCFVTRLLMGLCVGLVYGAMAKACKNATANCFVASLSAPLLNTLFFMGYIVLAFYHTDYVQSLVLAKGASNPLMFVILLTGIQGLVEAIVCSVAGTAIGGALLKVTGRMNGHR